jgi:hypothetical protein
MGLFDEDPALSGGAALIAPGSSAPYSPPQPEPCRGAYGDMGSPSPAKPLDHMPNGHASGATRRGSVKQALELGPQRLLSAREDRLNTWGLGCLFSLPRRQLSGARC